MHPESLATICLSDSEGYDEASGRTQVVTSYQPEGICRSLMLIPQRPSLKLVLRLALPVWIVGGCAPASPHGGSHPRREYIVDDGGARESASLISLPSEQALDQLFDLGQPEEVVGTLEGAPETIFGEIDDAVIVGDRVIVLDGRFSELRAFSRKGEFLWRAGRPGRGPAEFTHAYGLLVAEDGSLVVSDVTRRLQYFALSHDSARLVRTTQLPFAALDMCRLRNLTVVHALNAAETVPLHVLTSGDQPRLSFGSVYKSPNADLNYALSKGVLSCGTADSLIYFAPRSGLGEVRAFDGSGHTIWTTHLDGYRPTNIFDVPGGFGTTPPPDGFDRIESLVSIPGVGVVVQVAAVRIDSLQQVVQERLSTLLLDRATGRPLSGSRKLPVILAVAPNIWVSARSEPYPALGIHPR